MATILDKTHVERLFLAWLIKDRSFQTEYMSTFKAEDFSSKTNRRLFALIRDVKRPLDPGIFTSEFRKRKKAWGKRGALRVRELFRRAYLAKELPDRRYVVLEFERRLRVERSIDMFQQYGEQLEKGDIEGAEKVLRELITGEKTRVSGIQIDQEEIAQGLKARWKLIAEKKKHPERFLGVRTGFKKLDKLTGGLWKGEVGLVFGPTGIGKSMFLLNLSHRARLRGLSVMYITTEMPKSQVELRYDSLVSGIPYRLFKYGKLNRGQKKRWMQALMRTGRAGGKLYVISVPMGCSLSIIRQLVEEYREEHSLDLLVVDYLDMLTPPDEARRWSEQYMLGEVANGLKQIALYYDIPVWTASQPAYGSEEKDVWEATDVGYSRKKVQRIDLAVAIHKTDRDKEDGYITMQIVKHRDGEHGQFKLQPNFRYARLTEL